MFVETRGSHGCRGWRPISDSFSLGGLCDVTHFPGDPLATRDIIHHVLVPFLYEPLGAFLSLLRQLVAIHILTVVRDFVVLNLRSVK